jgi:hypothetical protein
MKAIAICLFTLVTLLGAQSPRAQNQLDSSGLDSKSPVVVNKRVEIDLNDAKNFRSLRNISMAAGGLALRDDSLAGRVESNPVIASQAFSSLGFNWTNHATGPQPEISVRYSSDGLVWSPWTRVIVDDHLTDHSSSQFYGNLLSVPVNTNQIQYAVNFDKQEKITVSPLLSTLSLSFIDPGVTSAVQAGQNLIPAPQMLSRTNWGCPEGEDSPRWAPSETSVTHIIVHHTVTSNTSPDWPASVRSIWSYHADTRGWGDIGYNFLIDPLGTIYRGRAGGDNIKGAHFSCQNNGTQGIALLGDFSSSLPTAEAQQSLEDLVAWIASREALDPVTVSYHAGTELNIFNISGHRDGNASTTTCSTTACPGDALYAQLPQIRGNVSTLIVNATQQPVNQASSLIAGFGGNYQDHADCYGMIEINGVKLANVYTAEYGCELHKLNDQGGSQILSDINQGPSGYTELENSSHLNDDFGLSPAVNGWYYFVANDGTHGRQLWRTDGSSVTPVGTGDEWSKFAAVGNRSILNGRLYLSVYSQLEDYQMYSTDGSALQLEPELLPNGSSRSEIIGTFHDSLLVWGEEDQHGREPWLFDGSQYQLLSDLLEGPESSLGNATSYVNFNDYWLFDALKVDTQGHEVRAYSKTNGAVLQDVTHSGSWYSDHSDANTEALIRTPDAQYLLQSIFSPLASPPPPYVPSRVVRINDVSSTAYELGDLFGFYNKFSVAVLGNDALALRENSLFRLGESAAEKIDLTIPSTWQGSEFEFVGSNLYFDHAYVKETDDQGSSRVWVWNFEEVGLLKTTDDKLITSADHFRHIGKDIYFYGEDDINGRALRKISDVVIRPVPRLAAITGSWYDPATSGQGLVLHPVNDELTVFSFYGFENSGKPLWLTAVSHTPLETGHSTRFKMYISSGGDFGSFNPDQITEEEWGTMTITFNTCSKATAELDGISGQQTMNLVRLAGLEGMECDKVIPPKPEIASITGSWFDPATSGQGFVLHPINDEQMVVSFYGYKDGSERLWLIGLYNGPVAMGESMLLDMTFASGGDFGAFDAKDITESTWGTLTIKFDDCNTATATLDGVDGVQTLNMVKLAGLQGSDPACH